MMKLTMYFFLYIFILSGCVHYSHQPYQNFLSTLKGATETELITKMGIPTKSYKTDEAMFINYYKMHSSKSISNYYYDSSSSTSYDIYCSTTFVLKNNKVTDYFFEGNSCGEYILDEKYIDYFPVF